MKNFIFLFLLFIGFSLFSQTKSGSLRKAKSYLGKNNYESAVAEYQESLKKDSNNYQANFEYGLLQTNYLNNPGEGGKFLLRAERLSKKDTASQIIYGLGEYYQYMGQYKKAISYYKRTFQYIEDDEDGTDLKVRINQSILDCEYALKQPLATNHKQIRIVNVGGGINTMFPEYVPVVNKDESIMMFTSRRKDSRKAKIDDTDGEYYEDMFIAYKDKKEGSFKGAHPFSISDGSVKDIPNTHKDHESVISISYNGDKFFTYRKNKIYESDLKNNVWSTPKELDTTINEDIFQNHVSISKDGKTIYFSSERKEGYGGLDLYKSNLQADGTWSRAVSLGASINSSKDEESPYISADGNTLYFSSKGHNGFGGYDIFKSKFDGTNWSTPENMGLPFNSAGNDIYMTIDSAETHGYFSSSRAGGFGDMDIYEITYLRAPFETYNSDIQGVIAFSAPDTIFVDQPVKYAINPSTLKNNAIKNYNWGVNDSVLVNHDNTENYTFSKEGTYKVRVEAQTEDNKYLSYEKNIIVIKKPVHLATNTFGLNPVYFNFNQSTIDESAANLIETNIKTLQNHPDALIEIAAFCDSRGTSAYNQVLSEKRAKAVIAFLKKKGFDIKRVKQVEWFGEKDPVNKCSDTVPCTEAEYRLNRRAEFRLINP